MRKGFENLFLYLDIPEDKKNYVLDIVGAFVESDQNILQRKCGPNYDGVEVGELSKDEKIRLHSTILPRIRSSYIVLSPLERGSKEYNDELGKLVVSFSKTRKIVPISNLLAYFNYLYTYEELNEVIKSLKEDEQEAIYAVCGELLDGNNTKEDTLPKFVRSKVNTHYMPKIRSRLKKLYPDRVVKEEQVLEEKKSDEVLVSKVAGILVKDNIGFTKEDYLDIVKIFNSAEFKELLRLNMPLEEIIVASLIHHGFQGKRFKIEDLEKFLGIDRETVIEIARKSTETYRMTINERINDYEKKLIKLMTDDNIGE